MSADRMSPAFYASHESFSDLEAENESLDEVVPRADARVPDLFDAYTDLMTLFNQLRVENEELRNNKQELSKIIRLQAEEIETLQQNNESLTEDLYHTQLQVEAANRELTFQKDLAEQRVEALKATAITTVNDLIADNRICFSTMAKQSAQIANLKGQLEDYESKMEINELLMKSRVRTINQLKMEREEYRKYTDEEMQDLELKVTTTQQRIESVKKTASKTIRMMMSNTITDMEKIKQQTEEIAILKRKLSTAEDLIDLLEH